MQDLMEESLYTITCTRHIKKASSGTGRGL